MAESISLAAPIAPPTITGYVPVSLLITIVPAPTVVVAILGNTGIVEVFTYPSPTGTAMDNPAAVAAMIQALNTANLSARSLWRRVFDRLLLDFPSRFAGGATVS